MRKERNILYNPYFAVPFLIWVIVGALLLIFFTRSQLFFAVNTHYSDLANVVFFFTTRLGQADIIIPVLLFLVLLPRFRNWWYFATAVLCNLVPFLIQQGLKSFFDWPRPRLLFYDRLQMHYLPDWPVYLSRSFPSGHSAGAFSFFCFLALLLPVRYRAFGLLFFFLALLVGYSRMYLAEHFFEDVYSGSILGTVITAAIFIIMKKYRGRFSKEL